MNQNSTDESNDFGDADDWMMAMRRLSEQLLYGLDSLTAKPDAQSLNNLLFIASLQSGRSASFPMCRNWQNGSRHSFRWKKAKTAAM